MSEEPSQKDENQATEVSGFWFIGHNKKQTKKKPEKTQTQQQQKSRIEAN